MNKRERQESLIVLRRRLDQWTKMSDESLFSSAKKLWRNITEANREECIKLLVLDFVEKMV